MPLTIAFAVLVANIFRRPWANGEQVCETVMPHMLIEAANDSFIGPEAA